MLTSKTMNLLVVLSFLWQISWCQENLQEEPVVEEEDQCIDNPTFKFKNVPIHPNIVEQLTNKDFRDKTIQPDRFAPKWRSFVYYINGPKQGQEFIICTTPKSGNSRTKMLLHKIVNKDYKGKFSILVYNQTQYNPLEYQNSSFVQKILSDKNIPRVIIVRDPYIRAISMFNSKISGEESLTPVRQKKTHRKSLQLPEDSKKITFNEFVQSLHRATFEYKLTGKKNINFHFTPQSTLCRYDLGMTYNYILKLENFEDWYDCFIDMLNLRDEVMHGWPNYDDCYYSSKKHPCNGPSMKKMDKNGGYRFTDSGSMVNEYYENNTIAKMVAEVFMADIVNFKYDFLDI
eukprot:TRINITY_DN12276_c2_g1_i4.p1 TRINITY_DN12276_c2_g1~~TRINITY_DN12276_c2_g1_i4.p1  ORF type:complete len:345 (-),score=27.21 TRINITY_DN12276_c2_g1_i4:360-1394(-)